MTTINDLADTIRAGLDDDEQTARAATAGPWNVDNETYAETIYGVDHVAVVAGGRWGGEASVFESTEDALHIARHDPARVLADVAWKRALLDAFLAEPHHHWPGVSACIAARFPDEPCGCGRDDRVTAYLRHLAQPYQETTC